MNLFKICEVCKKRKFYINHRSIGEGLIDVKMPLIVSAKKMCGKCFKKIRSKVVK